MTGAVSQIGAGSIVRERDSPTGPWTHAQISLAHAFSPRSLIEQEYLISKNIDAFIQKIHQDGSRGVDIAMAFTLMSFDVIGDFVGFGETFQGRR